MSLWFIAWQYLWNRRLTTSLTIASVALGVALITAVLTLREETRKRFEEEGHIYDMVVGAPGSPLQMVMSSVYLMDVPTGNISYEVYEQVRDHDDVDMAFPIGLGDTFQGFRIVGVSRDIFDYEWTHPVTGELRTTFSIAEGRFFEDNFEAVLGATVARRAGLEIGDRFVGVHGFMDMPEEFAHVHDDHPYEVVGILETSGTPNDRGIYTSLESVWLVHDHDHDHHHDDEHEHEHNHEHNHNHEHGHHHEHGHAHDHAPDEDRPDVAPADPMGDAADLGADEVTAVLVSLKSPADRFTFRGWVNRELPAMAAVPIMEIRDLYDNFLGTAQAVLLTIGYLVVVVSALSILIGLYLSIIQRKRDLAIMRALGASAPEIVGSVLIEAFLVTVLGIGAGWVVGNIVTWGVGLQLLWYYGLIIDAFGVPTTDMLTAFAAVAVVGVLAGILPAWQAYQTDVARDLSEA